MIQLVVKDGTCANQNHQIGQVFVVDSGFAPTTPPGVCVHAWNALAPYLMALILEGSFPWEEDESATVVHCPDPNGITWEIRRVKEAQQDESSSHSTIRTS